MKFIRAFLINGLRHGCGRFQRNKRGQGLVEYLIIVALVAVGTLGVMRIVGQSIQVKFAQISESLGAKTSGKIEQADVLESSYKKKDLKTFMQGTQNKGANSGGDGDQQ